MGNKDEAWRRSSCTSGSALAVSPRNPRAFFISAALQLAALSALDHFLEANAQKHNAYLGKPCGSPALAGRGVMRSPLCLLTMSYQEVIMCREVLWFRFLSAQEMNSDRLVKQAAETCSLKSLMLN